MERAHASCPPIRGTRTGAEVGRPREVFARYPKVAGAWSFGSHARGEARACSGVDLVVEPVDPGSAAARQRTLDMLSDLVRAGSRRASHVIVDRDDPVLRFEALREYHDTVRLRAIQREAYFDSLLGHDG